MDRRSILAAAPAAFLIGIAPGLGTAQQPRFAVGFLSSRSPEESAHLVAAFQRGLAETGFVEGKNLSVIYRWALGHYDLLPAMAAELVGEKVSVIFTAGGPPSALAAKRATSSIPIVFSAANDAVGVGLVASLSHPEGNVTGMSNFASGLAGKAIQLIKEAVPEAAVLAFLMNPSNPTTVLATTEVRQAADQLHVTLKILHAASETDLDAAFASLKGLGVGGLVVYGDPFFDSERLKIVGLAVRHRIPAIYAWRDYAISGGLMSYGSSLVDSYRRAATYVGRILKGESPRDLPIEQPAKFELVINLKTAKSLGLSLSPALLARADEIIE